MRKPRKLMTIACFALACHGAFAQNSAMPAAAVAADKKIPAYDVVAVKLNNTGSGHVSIHTDNGIYTASNVSLETLIESAYGYKRDQIVGLEGPPHAARFDISAKVIDPDLTVINHLSSEERGQMLQPILQDRFGLKFHKEMRVLPVYELLPAKGGVKLVKTSSVDVGAGDGKTFRGINSGSVNSHSTRTTAELTAHDVPLSVLVTELSGTLNRSVIDKTALTGKFDIWLRWTPEELSAAMDKSGDNTNTDAAPGLFTAIQEQLGLRLQANKDPIEVMVIDSIQMPTEN